MASVARTALVASVGILLCFMLTFVAAYAANDGTLDAAFDTDGIVTTNFGSADHGDAVATQSDGKIIVAGYAYTGQNYDFALARYQTDGRLDTTFGAGGKVTTDFFGAVEHASAVIVQPDGNIIVAGLAYQGTNIDFALAHYTSAGTLDPSFGGDGRVATAFGQYNHGQAVVLQNDGKLVVAGLAYINQQYDFVLARYGSDGTLDLSFDGDGKVITDLGGEEYGYSLALQADNKLVVAGYTEVGGTTDFAVVRYNSDGSLDPAFDGDGKVITDLGGEDYGYSLAIHPDNKMTIAGLTDTDSGADFALVRLNANGSLDLSFDGDGKVSTDLGGDDRGFSLGLQSDGKLVVAGQVSFTGPYDFGLVRYNSNGSLDGSMGVNGVVLSDFGADDRANALVIQSDGHVVVAGYSNIGGNADFALARYWRMSNYSPIE